MARIQHRAIFGKKTPLALAIASTWISTRSILLQVSGGAGFVLAGDLVVVHQRRRRSVRPAGWEARGYRRIGAVHLRLDGAYRFASGYLERSIQIGRSGGVI